MSKVKDFRHTDIRKVKMENQNNVFYLTHNRSQNIDGNCKWGELEARNCFQRSSFTKYLKQILVLM